MATVSALRTWLRAHTADANARALTDGTLPDRSDPLPSYADLLGKPIIMAGDFIWWQATRHAWEFPEWLARYEVDGYTITQPALIDELAPALTEAQIAYLLTRKAARAAGRPY